MDTRGGRFAIDRTQRMLLVGLPLLAGLVLGANQTRAGAYMPWLWSIGYWVTISVATWWLIAAATWIADRALRPWQPSLWLVWVVGAIAGSFVARPTIYTLTDLFRPVMADPVLRGMRPWRLDLDFLAFYLVNWSLVIAMWVVACAVAKQVRETAGSRGERSDPSPDPARRELQTGIFRRLPPSLGRSIVALQAEDHYVRVYTDVGDALVLGSISDAICDVTDNGFTGQRTHRSWWVTSAAIVAPGRDGRHIHLRLKNGLIVPVSLSYRRTLADNGILVI